MEHEELEEFERELRQALEPRPAPPGLKRRILERRSARTARRTFFARMFLGDKPTGRRDGASSLMWMRLAASLILVALLGGGIRWEVDKRQEERRGEEARQQVLTALRITTRALNQVQTRLAAHDRGE